MASPSRVQHLHLSSSDSLAKECMKQLHSLQVLQVLSFALLSYTHIHCTFASRTLPDHPTSCTQTVAFPPIPPVSGLNLNLCKYIPANTSSNHCKAERTQAWRCRYHVHKPRKTKHHPLYKLFVLLRNCHHLLVSQGYIKYVFALSSNLATLSSSQKKRTIKNVLFLLQVCF